jgi:hypothetical protein
MEEAEMTKKQVQDSIEHLGQVLRKDTQNLIARGGGLGSILAAAERLAQVVKEEQDHPGEGAGLCRTFLEMSVRSIEAEQKLLQYLDEHPTEGLYYTRFWNSLS